MARLLFRLYDPGQGRIRLGGRDLRDLDAATLRKQVGMVTQEVQLFQASIRDNLTFFNDEIPDEQIYRVLDELGLRTWLDHLPDGLDTLLASEGRGVSAGEAQLLAFTRVFLKDPGLIILDEPSSRMDPATERYIQNALGGLLRNRTAIIIAHRLSTVQEADSIMVLEQGRLVEHGRREDLVRNPKSHYARLLRTGLEDAGP
jgi:ABC-type multidrug transport system fused ATPase/permease subunit